MHDGRYRKLPKVLQHYNHIQSSATLAPELQNLTPLTSNERVDLVAFLLTLTDKEFLFNRGFGFPREVLLGNLLLL